MLLTIGASSIVVMEADGEILFGAFVEVTVVLCGEFIMNKATVAITATSIMANRTIGGLISISIVHCHE